MTMICPYCGVQNVDQAIYCQSCGGSLPIPQQAYPQSQGQSYGQPYPVPPPPPDFEPAQQVNAGASIANIPNATVRKGFCPVCNKRLNSNWFPSTACISCGTLYHAKCFSQGSLTCSSKSAIALFPAKRKQIVDSAIGTKMARSGAISWSRFASLPENEVIKDTSQTFCRSCAPMITQMASKVAENLEKAGRYEDAGDMFEEFGMFDAAGAARKKARAKVVTNISVDLNQLLDKLRNGGLVTVYKCPNCGGSIDISGATSTQKLSKCEYCGTVLQTDDLVNFIREILG